MAARGGSFEDVAPWVSTVAGQGGRWGEVVFALGVEGNVACVMAVDPGGAGVASYQVGHLVDPQEGTGCFQGVHLDLEVRLEVPLDDRLGGRRDVRLGAHRDVRLGDRRDVRLGGHQDVQPEDRQDVLQEDQRGDHQ